MAPENCAVVLFFSLFCLGSVLGTTDPGDYAVLDKFRKGLSNAELLEWPTDNQDPCGTPKWPHISCDRSRVTHIQVEYMGLNGTLPEDFNKLSMLYNVSLRGNKFSGRLPSFKGLSDLQFAHLGRNQFDTIPADFFVGLHLLQVLSLDENPLNASGWTLPKDLLNSAQLRSLSLVKCHLVGPLPEFLGRMNSLEVLKLSYNNLSGVIPASYSNPLLKVLWLDNQNGAKLSGTLDVIAKMTMLTDVLLNGNGFTGRIPSSIDALVDLQRIYIDHNRLDRPLPDSLMNLPSLRVMTVDNYLIAVPGPPARFDNVAYPSISLCRLAPGVPCLPEVTALLDFLGRVGYNMRLSESWKGSDDHCGWPGVSCSQDKKVTVLNLRNYGLIGTISPSLARLDSLTHVILGNNSITGTIPAGMTTMKSLKVLDLSYNKILPPVPSFPPGVKLILVGNGLPRA